MLILENLIRSQPPSQRELAILFLQFLIATLSLSYLFPAHLMALDSNDNTYLVAPTIRDNLLYIVFPHNLSLPKTEQCCNMNSIFHILIS